MAPGPPPLRSLGLVLHRDGRFLHEGGPVTNARLRAAFDRGVRYLPSEGKYVVTLGHFRGQVDVEECGFFVRGIDLDTGGLALSDGSLDSFDPTTLRPSSLDPDVLLCTVKRAIAPYGLPARFERGPQAELLGAVEVAEDGYWVRVAGRRCRLPVDSSERRLATPAATIVRQPATVAAAFAPVASAAPSSRMRPVCGPKLASS